MSRFLIVLGLLIVGAILLVVSFLYQRVARAPAASQEAVPPAAE